MSEPNVELSGHWVSALDAVHKLAQLWGDQIAKETLISRISDGAVGVGAQFHVYEADIGRIEWDAIEWGRLNNLRRVRGQRHPSRVSFAPQGASEALEIPRDFLLGNDDWVIDRIAISWPLGRLVAHRTEPLRKPLRSKVQVAASGSEQDCVRQTTVANEAVFRRAVSGLMFSAVDIDAMTRTASNSKSGPLGPSSNRIGRYQVGALDNAFDQILKMITSQEDELFLPKPHARRKIATFLLNEAAPGADTMSLRKTALRKADQLQGIWEKEVLERKSA